MTSFAFEFDDAAPPNTVAWLQGLASKLRVAPADLGFDSNVLTGNIVSEQARLVGIGVAVIPMPEGVRGVNDADTVDPMNLKLQVTGLLGNVFPGFAASTPFPQRLKMTVAAAEPPSIAALFTADNAPAITLQLGNALSPVAMLYDVILSLSFRVPVLHVHTPVSALR
jgi:hypothetical protein